METNPLSIRIGTGEYEPCDLGEALGLVLDQFPKDCGCGNRFNLSPTNSNAWEALPLHSIANGQETRVCPCGSHISIAIEFFEARPGLPAAFGDNRDPLDSLATGEPEAHPTNPGIYGPNSWGCP
jgi:hypothetical protein